MYTYTLFFITAMLFSIGYSSNFKQIKMLEIDNRIETNYEGSYENSFEDNELTSKKQRSLNFLHVKQHPHPTYAFSNGETLELTCDAFGSPAPSVHWFKNDAPVYEYDIESSEPVDPKSIARVVSTLLVQHTDDKDIYTCVITTGPESARFSSLIYNTDDSTELTERAKLYPLAPRVVYSYDIYAATIGTTVILPCKVKGHPKPHIVWKKNRRETVQQDSRIKVLRSGELVIASLKWSDMTEYTCVATNVFGSTVSRTFLYPIKAG